MGNVIRDSRFLSAFTRADKLDRDRWVVGCAVTLATMFGGPRGATMQKVLVAGEERFISECHELQTTHKLSNEDMRRMWRLVNYIAEKNIHPEVLLQEGHG